MKSVFEIYKELYIKGKAEGNAEYLKYALSILIMAKGYKEESKELKALTDEGKLFAKPLGEIKTMKDLAPYMEMMEKASGLSDTAFVRKGYGSTQLFPHLIEEGLKNHKVISEDEIITWNGKKPQEEEKPLEAKPDSKEFLEWASAFSSAYPKTEEEKKFLEEVKALGEKVSSYKENAGKDEAENARLAMEHILDTKKLGLYTDYIVKSMNALVDDLNVKRHAEGLPEVKEFEGKKEDLVSFVTEGIKSGKITAGLTPNEIRNLRKQGESIAKFDVFEAAGVPLKAFGDNEKVSYIASLDYGFDSTKADLNPVWRAYEDKTSAHANKQVEKFVFDHPETSKITSLAKPIDGRNYIYHVQEFKAEIGKEAKMQFTPEEKQGLKAIYEKMKEMHMFDVDKGFNGEDGNKFYSFLKLGEKRDAITEALGKKDIDAAYTLAKEYDQLMGGYRELISMVEATLSQDGLHTPGNVDSTRNGNIPLEFAKKPLASAQLNGLYLLGLAVENNGINPDEFFDHLEDADTMMLHAAQEGYAKKLEGFKNPKKPGAELGDFMLMRVDNNLTAGRALEILSDASREHSDSNKASAILNSNAICGAAGGNFLGSFLVKNGSRYTEPDFEGMRNYLAASDFYPVTSFYNNTMMNYETGEYFKSDFNYADFLKKDTRCPGNIFTELMDRLANAELRYSEQYNADGLMSQKAGDEYLMSMSEMACCAASFLADTVKERGYGATSPYIKKAMKSFLRNPLATVRNYTEVYKKEHGIETECQYIEDSDKDYENHLLSKDFFKNLDYLDQKDFSEASTELMNMDVTLLRDTYEKKTTSSHTLTAKNCLSSLAIARHNAEAYSKHGFWGRILRPSAYKERSLRNDIKNSFLRSGVTEAQYEEALGDLSNKKIFSICEALETRDDLESHKVDFIKYGELRKNQELTSEKDELHMLIMYSNDPETRAAFESYLGIIKEHENLDDGIQEAMKPKALEEDEVSMEEIPETQSVLSEEVVNTK